jgi:hypothetical protein
MQKKEFGIWLNTDEPTETQTEPKVSYPKIFFHINGDNQIYASQSIYRRYSTIVRYSFNKEDLISNSFCEFIK